MNADGAESGPGTCEPMTAKEKLARLKALFFPPETKAERVARALEALQRAIKKSSLDIHVIKTLAEDVDLEGI